MGDSRSAWEALGDDDPLWSILSDPDRRSGGWDMAEFMRTGQGHAGLIDTLLRDHGLSLGDRVLDFGCGVGRITNALAEHCDRVVGVDIAESMIEQARTLCRYPDLIDFVSWDGSRLPFADATFDTAASLMVVQHIPAAAQLTTLLELRRVVRPGGALVLQIPSTPLLPRALAAEALRADVVAVSPPSSIPCGRTATIDVVVTNRSPLPWPAEAKVRVGNRWTDGNGVTRDGGRTELQRDLLPTETVTVPLVVTAPKDAGEHRLTFDLIQDGVAWWAWPGGAAPSVMVTVGDPSDRGRRVPAESVVASGEAPMSTTIEMRGVDIELVQRLFTHCGCQIVAAVPDGMAGPEWSNFIYVIRRG